MQIALLAGLFTFTVLIFDRFTIVAPVVNLLVLPIFNFFTVPLALTGVLLDGPVQGAGDNLLIYAHKSVRVVLWIVEKAGEPSFASFRTTMWPSIAVITLPFLFVLLPAGWPGRRLGLVAIVAVLYNRPPSPPDGCLDYHALDVGQGLAVVLRTHRRTLLFDTGPSFQSGSNSADLVIMPFLSSIGVRRLDRLVVSHADLDHAGGVGSVINGIETAQLLVGEVLDVRGVTQTRCLAGDRWSYDGVEFTVLHPRKDSIWVGNNSSCVLEIVVGSHRLLLAGDIEAPVEKLLVHRSALRRSAVVFVPHHGSRTSSSMQLVNSTRPNFAIVSAGFGNRWGLPKKDVVERWQSAGTQVLATASSGAISQRVCRDRGMGPVRRERLESRKYWHDSATEAD
jgi:competence protein ComEC